MLPTHSPPIIWQPFKNSPISCGMNLHSLRCYNNTIVLEILSGYEWCLIRETLKLFSQRPRLVSPNTEKSLCVFKATFLPFCVYEVGFQKWPQEKYKLKLTSFSSTSFEWIIPLFPSPPPAPQPQPPKSFKICYWFEGCLAAFCFQTEVKAFNILVTLLLSPFTSPWV